MKIQYYQSDDWMHEVVRVVDEDGDTVAEVGTQADCPEDNTIGRLGIVGILADVVHSMGGKVQHEEVKELW